MKLIDADSLADKLRYMGYMDDNEELQELIDRFPEEKPRKGKWIRVHTGEYRTPGNDPMWKCSVCGLGQHVWGNNHDSYVGGVTYHQWITCPNCGTVMEGEQW